MNCDGLVVECTRPTYCSFSSPTRPLSCSSTSSTKTHNSFHRFVLRTRCQMIGRVWLMHWALPDPRRQPEARSGVVDQKCVGTCPTKTDTLDKRAQTCTNSHLQDVRMALLEMHMEAASRNFKEQEQVILISSRSYQENHSFNLFSL